MAQKREKSLTDILRFYGMPEENIDLAINQIAESYGEIAKEGEDTKKTKVIRFGDFSNIIADKVVHFGIDESNKRCFKIFLEGPFEVTNQYDTEEFCKTEFEKFVGLMNKA